MCAEKTLDKISEDGWRWFDEAYNQSFRIDYVSSMNDCTRKGLKQGREQKAIEDARNLLVMKVLSHEQISQAIGLPLEKVEELAAELTSV